MTKLSRIRADHDRFVMDYPSLETALPMQASPDRHGRMGHGHLGQARPSARDGTGHT